MKERIRELVRQAGLDDADFPIENWDNVPLAKFAELIVRECIITVKKRYMGDNNREDMEVRHCVEDLKQHFGVNE